MAQVLKFGLVFFLLFQGFGFSRGKQEEILRKRGIRKFEVPIHDQDREWLTENFKKGARKYPININLLLRNIIWQQRQLRVIDKKPPFEGNLRGFWYAYIKPTLAEAGVLNPKYDQYNTLIQQVRNLILVDDVMRYKDFGFFDDNEHRKLVGDQYHIILFAEKENQFPFLRRIHKTYGITIIALGGLPSVLSSEYFVDDLRKRKIDIRQKFYLFSMVDYDPSGLILRNAFVENLEFYGMKHVEVFDLVRLDLMTEDGIYKRMYPIPQTKRTKKKNEKWLKETGGIDGELLGLETEAIHPKKIEELLKTKIEPLRDKMK